MNTSGPAIRQKSEAALAAYLRNRAEGDADLTVDRAGSVLHGLPVYLGQSNAAWKYPCVTVICSKATQAFGGGTPWYDVGVMVRALTGLASETGSQSQADMVAAVNDLLVDDVEDGEESPRMALLLSIPLAGPDTRPVKAFTVLGYSLGEEDGIVTEKHWDDATVVQLLAMPLDPAA